jgi:hypothetical protein
MSLKASLIAPGSDWYVSLDSYHVTPCPSWLETSDMKMLSSVAETSCYSRHDLMYRKTYLMRYDIKSKRKERVLSPVPVSIRHEVLLCIPEGVVVWAQRSGQATNTHEA